MDNGNQNQLQGVKMKYFYENTSVRGGRILSSNIGRLGGGGGGRSGMWNRGVNRRPQCFFLIRLGFCVYELFMGVNIPLIFISLEILLLRVLCYFSWLNHVLSRKAFLQECLALEGTHQRRTSSSLGESSLVSCLQPSSNLGFLSSMFYRM